MVLKERMSILVRNTTETITIVTEIVKTTTTENPMIVIMRRETTMTRENTEKMITEKTTTTESPNMKMWKKERLLLTKKKISSMTISTKTIEESPVMKITTEIEITEERTMTLKKIVRKITNKESVDNHMKRGNLIVTMTETEIQALKRSISPRTTLRKSPNRIRKNQRRTKTSLSPITPTTCSMLTATKAKKSDPES